VTEVAVKGCSFHKVRCDVCSARAARGALVTIGWLYTQVCDGCLLDLRSQVVKAVEWVKKMERRKAAGLAKGEDDEDGPVGC